MTAAAGAGWEAPLVRGLQRRELGVDVLRRCVDQGDLLGSVRRDRPAAVVVAAELPWLDRELVGELQDAGTTVIAVGTAADGRDIDRLGITYAVGSEATADDLAALLHRRVARVPDEAMSCDSAGVERSGADSGPSPGRGRVGRIVAVWGAPGAPGRTTVAVHAALECARAGTSALLVDGDCWAPSVAQSLALEPEPSVARAARRAMDGWPEPFAGCVQSGPNRLDVLVGLPRAALWPEMRLRPWQAVLDAAREHADVVVVDLAAPLEEDEELAFDRVPYRRNAMTHIALEAAARVLLVVRGDPLGVRRGIEAFRTLQEAFPAAAERVDVVLNRVPIRPRDRQGVSALLSEWTGVAPAVLLPAEPAFEQVAWEGRPLHSIAPRSRWLRELRELRPLAPATEHRAGRRRGDDAESARMGAPLREAPAA